MATAGKPLDNDDIISYVLAGLDEDYEGFVAFVNALLKEQKTISLGDMYSMFLACEAQIETEILVVDLRQTLRLEEVVDSEARMGNGGRYDQRGNNYRGNDMRPNNSYDNHGNGVRGYNNQQGYRPQYGGGDQGPKPVCQVCGKEGHTALNAGKDFRRTTMVLRGQQVRLLDLDHTALIQTGTVTPGQLITSQASSTSCI
jgi:hypothetical protein